MSNASLKSQRAFVLYVSGVGVPEIRGLTEVEKLMKCGVMVELESTPITGPQAHYYQLFSGQSPARFGFFDTLMPRCHLPQWQQGTSSYAVAETDSGPDAAPRMLPDLLRAAGWEVAFEETSPAALVACVQGLARAEAAPTAPTCHVVKCALGVDGQPGLPTAASREAIAQALRVARSWAGATGLLALLSDIQPAPVERFININNFLAEMGILDRDGQSGLIDWPNSLAYYAGHGQLWINLLGRDPQGAVHPQGEYEEVRDSLVKGLPARLRDAGTGTPILERIYRKEELYPDKYLFCAPDLVVVFKPGYAPSPASTRLGFDEATCTTAAEGSVAIAGAHPSTLRGFLLVSAPSIVPGSVLPEPAPLTSALPTLLHALGVEHVGMDGQALGELFSPAYLETHPIQASLRDGELSEEDEELIINRLRDLGYV
jgi:hypothetical protein